MSAKVLDTPDIKVSVVMITYNHEQYIAQAIEGVLMQQTDFAVELVIGEDCSTDRTRELVRSYEERYPGRVRLLLPERNLGMVPNFVATLKACRGQYIALCEGDDYWVEPLKLQKQVDFMEANPDHAICFHRIYQLVQATGGIGILKLRRQRSIKPSYNLDDVVRGKVFVPTASMMLRNGLIPEFPIWFYEAPVGDWPLLVLLAQHGKIGLIDQFMAVHRIHGGGAWSGANESAHEYMVNSMFETLRKHLGPRYEKQFRAGISNHFLDKAALSTERGEVKIAKAQLLRSITEYPLNPDMRILDKLVLFGRLYTPFVYKIMKRLQPNLHYTKNSSP